MFHFGLRSNKRAGGRQLFSKSGGGGNEEETIDTWLLWSGERHMLHLRWNQGTTIFEAGTAEQWNVQNLDNPQSQNKETYNNGGCLCCGKSLKSLIYFCQFVSQLQQERGKRIRTFLKAEILTSCPTNQVLRFSLTKSCWLFSWCNCLVSNFCKCAIISDAVRVAEGPNDSLTSLIQFHWWLFVCNRVVM